MWNSDSGGTKHDVILLFDLDTTFNVFRRQYVFEMHEAVQEAHCKFSVDSKLQSQNYAPTKDQFTDQIKELKERIEDLERENQEKTHQLEEKEHLVIVFSKWPSVHLF